VVQSRQRKGAGRDEKWPTMGLQAGPHGSEEWPQRPAFCAIPAGDKRRKKNVPNGKTGGGRGTVVKPSSVIGLRGSRAPSWHRLRGWWSGRGHSSVRGRRVRPPQVGVRRARGTSISEAAWSRIERARPVTAEGSSMSPLPRVPAGRFRRSGTVIALRPPDPGPAALCAGAIVGIDPIVGDRHLGARASRRAKPPAQPAPGLTHEYPDAAF
jgi:hypothetical protein